MTSNDRPEFRALVERMARAYTKRIDDAFVADLFEDLQDIDLSVLDQAAQELRRNAVHFPRVSHWRAEAQKIRSRAAVQHGIDTPPVVQLEGGGSETTFFCLRCEDTGWRPACGCDAGRMEIFTARCPFHGPKPVEEKRRMSMAVCDCRDRNPSWLRQHPTKYVDPQRASA